MSIKFHLSRSLPESLANDSIIICDDKAQFEKLTLDSNICKAAKIKSSIELELIKAAAAQRLKPDTDNGSSIELFLAPSAELPLRRVVLASLSTQISRSNTPARSHSLAALVKSNKGSGNLTVIVAPKKNDYAFAQSVSVGRNFPLYSLKSKKAEPYHVDVIIDFPEAVKDGEDEILVKEAGQTVDSIRMIQKLVDAPPNELHTDAYVDEAKALASRLGCQIKVIRGEELRDGGFGGIWGVGKASLHLPALVILSFYPTGFEKEESIAMVGKGIVYDTGGLSIKTPSTNMAGMKHDMGGSAAVFGAFETLVQTNGLKSPIHALLCLAENSVDSLATRPDDVHTFLSGKTVEVNNTDAEGRLVLGDGVYYASKYLSPRVIIDIATLTGAQLIATGKNIAALYCNDDELEAKAVQVGKETGDLTHPLPYCPEFFRSEFKSQIADMKNSVADRGNAQSSCAGQFIGNHLEEYLARGGKWLHIDMAGPVCAGERATGYGVALLFKLCQKLSRRV